MIDPVDCVTQALPVTVPCPIKIDFESPDRHYSLVLEQDLFEQWSVMQSRG
jgi:hypothetical protein